MSSSFVSLTSLHTLVISITDAHCPSQPLMVKTQATAKSTATTPGSPLHRRTSEVVPSTASVAEQSPSSSHASLAQSEPGTVSPSSSPRMRVRRASVSLTSAALQNLTMNTIGLTSVDDIAPASVQGITGNIGSFDTSVPPKRDIRKFARRCPSLRILRWAGRQGKGEWRIAVGSSSIHTSIDFVPVHLVEDDEADGIALGSGADVENFIKRKRTANCPPSGKPSKDDTDSAPNTGLPISQKPGSAYDGHTTQQLRRASAGSGNNGGHSVCPATWGMPRMSAQGGEQVTPTKKNRPMVTLAHDRLANASSPETKQNNSEKLPKSYAAISDPFFNARAEVGGLMGRTEARMTVLGESNRKKPAVNGITVVGSLDALPAFSVAKTRTVTKVRGPDDGYSGATIIIGQGIGVSAVNGAAGRRAKKKGRKGEDEHGSTKKSSNEASKR